MYAIRKTGTDLYFCGISSKYPFLKFQPMNEGYICAFQLHSQAKEYMDFAIEHKWVNFSMEVDIV